VAKEMDIPRSTLQNHLSGVNKGFLVGRSSKSREAQEVQKSGSSTSIALAGVAMMLSIFV